MMKNLHLVLALFILLLSACAGSAEPTLLPGPPDQMDGPAAPAESIPEAEAPAIGASEPTAEPSEVIVTPEIEIPAGAEVLVDLAKADLSQQLGVDQAGINLLSYEELVWPDSSLGCPQPGMEYLQVPHDGARIILELEGTSYHYHSGGEIGLFLCEQNILKKDEGPKIDLGDFITPSPPSDQ